MSVTTVNIRFKKPLNVSVTEGDILYGTTGFQSGVNNPFNDNAPVKIGEITSVKRTGNQITITTSFSVKKINKTFNYLFFNKPKYVSMSGILGYYALTEYRNYSKNEAEMFATGTEYAPSSK